MRTPASGGQRRLPPARRAERVAEEHRGNVQAQMTLALERGASLIHRPRRPRKPSNGSSWRSRLASTKSRRRWRPLRRCAAARSSAASQHRAYSSSSSSSEIAAIARSAIADSSTLHRSVASRHSASNSAASATSGSSSRSPSTKLPGCGRSANEAAIAPTSMTVSTVASSATSARSSDHSCGNHAAYEPAMRPRSPALRTLTAVSISSRVGGSAR